MKEGKNLKKIIYISSILMGFFLIATTSFGQSNDTATEPQIALPDISKEGIGSEVFKQKGEKAIDFLEKFRLDLKNQIEVKKNNYQRVEIVEENKTEANADGVSGKETIQDLEKANSDFMYYFLVFALFIVSNTFLFYGLIIVLVLIVLKTFFSRR